MATEEKKVTQPKISNQIKEENNYLAYTTANGKVLRKIINVAPELPKEEIVAKPDNESDLHLKSYLLQ